MFKSHTRTPHLEMSFLDKKSVYLDYWATVLLLYVLVHAALYRIRMFRCT